MRCGRGWSFRAAGDWRGRRPPAMEREEIPGARREWPRRRGRALNRAGAGVDLERSPGRLLDLKGLGLLGPLKFERVRRRGRDPEEQHAHDEREPAEQPLERAGARALIGSSLTSRALT